MLAREAYLRIRGAFEQRGEDIWLDRWNEIETHDGTVGWCLDIKNRRNLVIFDHIRFNNRSGQYTLERSMTKDCSAQTYQWLGTPPSDEVMVELLLALE